MRLKKQGKSEATPLPPTLTITLKNGESAFVQCGEEKLAVHDTGSRNGALVMIDGDFIQKNFRREQSSSHNIANTIVHVIYQGRQKEDTK